VIVQLPLQTARLTLRPFTDADLDDLYAYQSLPEVATYVYWDARTREQSAASLATKTAQTSLAAEGDTLALAAVSHEHRRVVGEVTLSWASAEHHQGEIGFVFNPRFQGRGFATEAALATLRLGFAGAGFHRIYGRCDALNTASARLMERLGMRREAHFVENEIFKGRWGDEFVYAMLESEWRKVIG
jgi:RimJ/RimL family protein N-acetyltransferase